MKKTILQILLAILLVAVQTLVFDNLQIRSGITTFAAFHIYIFFLVALPTSVTNFYLLIYAFLLGLTVDIFSDTLGINASASVALAFVRPYALKILSGEKYTKHITPSIYSMGAKNFFYYALTLSAAFHFMFCILEVFTFYQLYLTMLRMLSCSLISVFMIMLIEILFLRGKKTSKQ